MYNTCTYMYKLHKRSFVSTHIFFRIGMNTARESRLVSVLLLRPRGGPGGCVCVCTGGYLSPIQRTDAINFNTLQLLVAV